MWSLKSQQPNKEPGWISDLPDEGDQQTLRALIEGGADLTKPREIIFCIYATADGVNRLKEETALSDWECTVQESADPNVGPLNRLIELKKDEYVIDREKFEADASMMQALADKHGAEYDGWYASV